MRPASLTLALAGWLLSAAAFGADPGFCHSVCDSERRACKADAAQLAAEDGEGLLAMAERNQFARTAARTQTPSQAALADERSSMQARRIKRTAACDTTYQRCTRTCKAPDLASPVLTPKKS